MTYSGAGTHFINQSDTTTLTAKVYEDGADVTDAIHESAFIWTRESGDAGTDEVWNQAHIGIKQITVTPTDISERAIIACSLLSAADMTLSFSVDAETLEVVVGDPLYGSDSAQYDALDKTLAVDGDGYKYIPSIKAFEISKRLPIARYSMQFTFLNDIALRAKVASLP